MKIMRSAIDQMVQEEVAVLESLKAQALEEDLNMEELRSVYEKHYKRPAEPNAQDPEGHAEVRFEIFGDGFFDGQASERIGSGENFFGLNALTGGNPASSSTPISEDYINGYDYATNGKAQEHYKQMRAEPEDDDTTGREKVAMLVPELPDQEESFNERRAMVVRNPANKMLVEIINEASGPASWWRDDDQAKMKGAVDDVVKAGAEKIVGSTGINIILDIWGIFWPPADIINATLYWRQGEHILMALALLAAVPGIGEIIFFYKRLRGFVKVASNGAMNVIKGTERAVDAAGNATRSLMDLFPKVFGVASKGGKKTAALTKAGVRGVGHGAEAAIKGVRKLASDPDAAFKALVDYGANIPRAGGEALTKLDQAIVPLIATGGRAARSAVKDRIESIAKWFTRSAATKAKAAVKKLSREVERIGKKYPAGTPEYANALWANPRIKKLLEIIKEDGGTEMAKIAQNAVIKGVNPKEAITKVLGESKGRIMKLIENLTTDVTGLKALIHQIQQASGSGTAETAMAARKAWKENISIVPIIAGFVARMKLTQEDFSAMEGVLKRQWSDIEETLSKAISALSIEEGDKGGDFAYREEMMRDLIEAKDALEKWSNWTDTHGEPFGIVSGAGAAVGILWAWTEENYKIFMGEVGDAQDDHKLSKIEEECKQVADLVCRDLNKMGNPEYCSEENRQIRVHWAGQTAKNCATILTVADSPEHWVKYLQREMIPIAKEGLPDKDGADKEEVKEGQLRITKGRVKQIIKEELDRADRRNLLEEK